MSAVNHYAPPATDAESLGNEIAELCGYIHAATCRLLDLIHEFDELRGWEEQGFRSCVEWLNFHCGLGPGAAREHLRVAQALPDLRKIRDAFRSIAARCGCSVRTPPTICISLAKSRTTTTTTAAWS